MTDTPAPKTLVLQPGEWKALTVFSMQALLGALDGVANLADDGAAEAQAYLARSGQLIEAWRRSCRQAEHDQQPQPPSPEPPREAAPVPNGPVRVDITRTNQPNRAERRRQKRRELQPN